MTIKWLLQSDEIEKIDRLLGCIEGIKNKFYILKL